MNEPLQCIDLPNQECDLIYICFLNHVVFLNAKGKMFLNKRPIVELVEYSLFKSNILTISIDDINYNFDFDDTPGKHYLSNLISIIDGDIKNLNFEPKAQYFINEYGQEIVNLKTCATIIILHCGVWWIGKVLRETTLKNCKVLYKRFMI